jgi:hypothetical protein
MQVFTSAKEKNHRIASLNIETQKTDDATSKPISFRYHLCVSNHL